MTCAEFREVIRRNPDLCTASELIALKRHGQKCHHCYRYVQNSDHQFQTLDKEEAERRYQRVSERVMAALQTDPEV